MHAFSESERKYVSGQFVTHLKVVGSFHDPVGHVETHVRVVSSAYLL